VHDDDSSFEVLARVAAAKTCGCSIVVSAPDGTHDELLALLADWTRSWSSPVAIVRESDEQLVEVIAAIETDRVRYAAPERVPVAVLQAVGETGIYVARAPVLAEGRVELLWYVTEQSISHDYHRYGNLGMRGDEQRREVS
jgi:RHH-type proline utilization regulon transcriptional repressor/proline dehydrogenase/delta 1-pyrroline-5-carboxylate dehydrogenase